MHSKSLLTLLAAATAATVSIAADTVSNYTAAQNTPPAELRPPVSQESESLRPDLTPAPLGLRPQATSGNKDGIALPFGLNYNRETKSLLVPMDQKNEWGVGLNLNLNSTKALELTPGSSSLGLQPKRTPGVMLQKKF